MPMKKRNGTRGDVKGGEIMWTLGLRNVLATHLKTLRLGFGLLIVSWAAAAFLGTTLNSSASSPAQEMREGRARFEQADLRQAAIHWMTAARLYEEREQPKEQCQALINSSHALQQEGQIRRAQSTLQTALTLSERIGNRLLTAIILGQLAARRTSWERGIRRRNI